MYVKWKWKALSLFIMLVAECLTSYQLVHSPEYQMGKDPTECTVFIIYKDAVESLEGKTKDFLLTNQVRQGECFWSVRRYDFLLLGCY